jgi:hypothetical protein
VRPWKVRSDGTVFATGAVGVDDSMTPDRNRRGQRSEQVPIQSANRLPEMRS